MESIASREEAIRSKVRELSDEEREGIIQKLWVSHTVFQNWLDGKDGLGSKKRNKLIHLLA